MRFNLSQYKMKSLQEKQFWITTHQLAQCIFILPHQQIIAHFRAYHPPKTQSPQLNICYLTITSSIDLIQRLHHELYKNHKEKAFRFNVSITPFSSEEEAMSHLESMKKICGVAFEQKYVQMMQKVEKNIQNQLVYDFCLKQLQWKTDKIAHTFGIGQNDHSLTIEQLLAIKCSNQAERRKIQELRDVLQDLSLA